MAQADPTHRAGRVGAGALRWGARGCAKPADLLAPLATREAVLSSRIEGTQATMDEVLQFEAGQEPALPQRRNDILEVLNYRAAMRQAENSLEELPLSQRVVREAHAILLRGVRAGASRRAHIGGYPTGSDHRVAPLMRPASCRSRRIGSRGYGRVGTIHPRERARQACAACILHAEFEALHPFLDGNGRLGRMFVPLFLWQTGLVRAHVFYISAYFESRARCLLQRPPFRLP